MKLLNIIILLSMFVLVSCIPIRVVPKYNPDLYNGYKLIQAYQKKDTIGHTDVEQRKKDAFACGVINYNGGNLDLNVVYPDQTFEQTDKRSKSVYNCMKDKGYIIGSRLECTNNGKPTGSCN